MTEEQLICRLQRRDIRAFEALVHGYFENMVILAYILVQDSEKANEIVSDLLLRLYKTDDLLGLKPPLEAFLISQVRAACQRIPEL